ncbi:restriction endonuclease subunit S [Mycobacterium sp. IS-1556]|uniref:restriction endonuclease subunit S n=1 Tax=Mycobacterium sp. IS-1556 TaxID=1772276 RepID=UPI0015616FAD|nr:restriction endonuclease subunit S [Mycobacterium sp. IS-1556]
MGSTVGARRLRVHPDHLLSLEVPLPDVQEQDRVVQRIRELSRCHVHSEAELKSTEAYAKAILASARAEMVSPDRLKTRMAEGWKAVQLGDLADFVNGTSYDSNQLVETGTPIIRISNISDPSSDFLYTAQDFDDRFMVDEKDLLVSWSASFKSIIWPGPRGVLNQHIFAVTERSDTHRGFLRHLIEAVFDDMRTQAVGIGMMHLRRDAFLTHPVVVPDSRTQQSIAESLDRIEERVATIRRGQKTMGSLLSALGVSILNTAFDGLL